MARGLMVYPMGAARPMAAAAIYGVLAHFASSPEPRPISI